MSYTPRQQAEASSIMHAVGDALQAWSTVERGLAEIFKHVMGIEDHIKADIVFSEMSANSKIKLLSTLISYDPNISDSVKSEWAILTNKMTRLSKKETPLHIFL